ncbi:MAG: hypothetical protein D6811_12150 [Alphaproteobacteria bacterium]|nr:MAG: hypothetical protein D6811_12150 [Alphaproteobacteria bacterium]
MAIITLSTTPVTTWATDLSQLGPIYPFVGWETLLVIAGVIFWLWFHFAQMRVEAMEFEKDAAAAREPEVLKRVFQEEAQE